VNLRIGTRGSALALAQATDVARRLEARGHTSVLEVITTVGDRDRDRSFSDLGTPGVFVREIETALLEGRVDLAVHSYKDLPAESPDNLIVAAVPERLDAADLLLVRLDAAEPGLPIPVRQGATVGTSSTRRQALLRASRPDLTIWPLRGNVPTRIQALREARYDAIILAAAGLSRLQRTGALEPFGPECGMACIRLDPRVFVPAPTQGAIAVQVHQAAEAVRQAVTLIHDPSGFTALRAERALLERAGAGCQVPFGAWCEAQGDRLRLLAVLGRDDGRLARGESCGDDPDLLADRVWHALQNGSLS